MFKLSVLKPVSRHIVVASLCALTMAGGPVCAQVQGDEAARQKLAEKLVTLWHPENVAVMMVQKPATDAFQQARIALQGRVSAERRDVVLKDIAKDVQKYVDEATPIAKESAKKDVALTVIPMLVKNFSESELKELISILESPVKKKFEQMVPQMERALGERVAADNRDVIDPKLKEMTKEVGLKLRAASMVQ